MKSLTIHTDAINNKISILYGFEVDYNQILSGKNFNNNGVWGLIVNKGEVVHSVSYNPNKCEPNFGQSDYSANLAFMKKQLSVYQSLQPKQIESIINEGK